MFATGYLSHTAIAPMLLETPNNGGGSPAYLHALVAPRAMSAPRASVTSLALRVAVFCVSDHSRSTTFGKAVT